MATKVAKPTRTESYTSKQMHEDKKLAESPRPSEERAAQGDWAKSNNPSPEEQAAEQARIDAQRRLDNGG